MSWDDVDAIVATRRRLSWRLGSDLPLVTGAGLATRTVSATGPEEPSPLFSTQPARLRECLFL